MNEILSIRDNITTEIKNEIDTVRRAQKIMTTMMVMICFMPLLIIFAFLLGKRVGKSSERRKAKRRDRRKRLIEKGVSHFRKSADEDMDEQDESDDEFDFEDNDFMFVD